MTFISHMILNIILLLAMDSVWLKLFAGPFFAKQIEPIARLTEAGEWDVRLMPAVLVYILMALSIELFIFKNESLRSKNQKLIHGALLGLVVYGVYDFTNRALIDHYPMAMVIVDVCWGVFLFAAVTYVNHELRKRLSFL